MDATRSFSPIGPGSGHTCLEANTIMNEKRPAGVCEIMKKNSSVMEENCRLADILLSTLGGHQNEEKRCSPPIDSLLSETVYQEDLLNEINRKLNAAIALLTGER